MFEGFIPDNWKTNNTYQLMLVFCLGVFVGYKGLAPVVEGNLRFDLREAGREVSASRAEIEARETKLTAARKQIEVLERRLAKADSDIRDAQSAGLFIAGSPYPVGLSEVRIGDPISKLDALYPGKIEKKEGRSWWSLNRAHSIVYSATYYQTGDKVTQILFHLDSSIKGVDKEFLHRKLREALGEPVISSSKNQRLWENRAGTSVVMDVDDDSSSIFLVRAETKQLSTMPKGRDIPTGSTK
jgi:hypothetical protein